VKPQNPKSLKETKNQGGELVVLVVSNFQNLHNLQWWNQGKKVWNQAKKRIFFPKKKKSKKVFQA
jgi:hypothetical protein